MIGRDFNYSIDEDIIADSEINSSQDYNFENEDEETQRQIENSIKASQMFISQENIKSSKTKQKIEKILFYF